MTTPGINASLLEPSDLFEPAFRNAAVDAFGSDGAWLLLSTVLYGWRVQYDLACALLASGPPTTGSGIRPDPVGIEFEIARDLQIQSMLFAVSEQFATLLRAALLHVPGEPVFFDEYVRAPQTLAAIIDRLGNLDRSAVVGVVGDPQALPKEFGPPVNPEVLAAAAAAKLDDAAIEAERQRARGVMIGHAEDLIGHTIANASQLRFLIDPAPMPEHLGIKAPALREVDNSFRHGVRVLFQRAVPDPRFYAAVGEGASTSEYNVDLYLPDRKQTGNRVTIGSVECTVDRTREHMESLRHLSQRTVQIALGLLGNAVEGSAAMFVRSIYMELPPTPEPFGSGGEAAPAN